MSRAIQVTEWTVTPPMNFLADEGWDPNAISGDEYESPRALALYAALGADPSDDEYTLAGHADGRWALFGLTTQGHRYAVEVAS